MLFPANFQWRELGHWMIPNLWFCHHGNLCKSQSPMPACFQGSAPGKMRAREVALASFPGHPHCKTEDQLFQPSYSCSSGAVDSFIQGKTGASICSEGLQSAENSIAYGLPAQSFFWSQMNNMLQQRKWIIKAHFSALLWLRWTSESLLLTCTVLSASNLKQPPQKEESPPSLPVWMLQAGLDLFLRAFSQKAIQLANSNPMSSTWKAQQQVQEAVSTSTLQKAEAPPSYSSQLHAPPASYSMSRVWREGKGRRSKQSFLSLGMPDSQAEKHSSTFWLVWTLGTSASIDLLDSLNQGRKAPMGVNKHQSRLFRGCGISSLRDTQQWTGQGPEKPDPTLKLAPLWVGDSSTYLQRSL